LTAIGGNLEVINNYALTSIAGLNNLIFIGGDVSIDANSVLNSLSGLENLSLIEGGIEIGGGVPLQSGNPSLLSLTGLDNLSSIGGWFSIYDNNGLTSLNGIGNIDPNSISHLSIWDNNYLSSCEVQSVCNYLASPNGIIEIYDTAPGFYLNHTKPPIHQP